MLRSRVRVGGAVVGLLVDCGRAAPRGWRNCESLDGCATRRLLAFGLLGFGGAVEDLVVQRGDCGIHLARCRCTIAVPLHRQRVLRHHTQSCMCVSVCVRLAKLGLPAVSACSHRSGKLGDRRLYAGLCGRLSVYAIDPSSECDSVSRWQWGRPWYSLY